MVTGIPVFDNVFDMKANAPIGTWKINFPDF